MEKLIHDNPYHEDETGLSHWKMKSDVKFRKKTEVLLM